MKNPQLLQLIQKGGRHQPAIYRFGANETLKIYAGGQVDICNAKTDEVVHVIDKSWLRDWGYSPAKLFASNTEDQFIDERLKASASEHAINALRGIGFTTLLAGLFIVVSNTTGCTDYVFTQLDKDIATTATHPVDNYERQLEFKQSNEHANRFLANNRN